MISAVVNTSNEEKYIGRCLEHLKWTDEVIPEGLAREILRLINSNPDFVAISFPCKNIYFGRWLKHAYPIVWQTRCFKRNRVSYLVRVHSQPKIIGGNVYTLANEEKYQIIHYDSDTISRFIEKMNRYTSAEAYHIHHDDEIKFRILFLIKKPIAEFKNRFFLCKGYKDGMEGFLFCVLMAFYRFVAWAKLWEMEKK